MTRREQLLLVAVAGALLVGAVSLYWHRNHAGPAVPSATEAVASVESAAALAVSDTGPAGPAEPMPVPAVDEAAPPQEPATVAVSAAGAVRRPGLYKLDTTARVQDLLSRAGGASEEGDLSDINLAAQLIDGSTLTIPARSRILEEDGTLVARGGPPASELNPAPYTISGWHPDVGASGPDGSRSDSSVSAPVGSVGGLVNLNTATQDQLETLPGIGPKLAAEIISYRSQMPFRTIEDLDQVPGFGAKRLESVRPLITAP